MLPHTTTHRSGRFSLPARAVFHERSFLAFMTEEMGVIPRPPVERHIVGGLHQMPRLSHDPILVSLLSTPRERKTTYPIGIHERAQTSLKTIGRIR